MIVLLQANRDAGIREAESEKAAMDVKYSTDSKIDNNMTDLLQAKRDAGIREAECEKAAMDVKYSTDTKIENN
jgi:flotillin